VSLARETLGHRVGCHQSLQFHPRSRCIQSRSDFLTVTSEQHHYNGFNQIYYVLQMSQLGARELTPIKLAKTMQHQHC